MRKFETHQHQMQLLLSHLENGILAFPEKQKNSSWLHILACWYWVSNRTCPNTSTVIPKWCLNDQMKNIPRLIMDSLWGKFTFCGGTRKSWDLKLSKKTLLLSGYCFSNFSMQSNCLYKLLLLHSLPGTQFSAFLSGFLIQ